MSDLVGNPEDKFCHDAAHMVMLGVGILDLPTKPDTVITLSSEQ